MLGNIASQLSHFDFFFEISFETSVYDLPLARLESINDRGNRSAVVLIGEVNELLMNKLGVCDSWCIIGKYKIGVIC